MSARDALERALAASRRAAELREVLRGMDGVGAVDYASDGRSAQADRSWRTLDLVERRREASERLAECEAVVDEAAAAIWKIETGSYDLDWRICTVLEQLYILDRRPIDVARELHTSPDGVRNLKKRGIRWLDAHLALC